MTTYFATAPQQSHRFRYTLRPESFAGQLLGGLAAVAIVAQAVYLVGVAAIIVLYAWAS
jgi:hypothetical protein